MGKSILDGTKVVNKAFASDDDFVGSPVEDETHLSVVGNCPKCGAAVYGKAKVYSKEDLVCRYSCECHTKKSFQDTIETK